MSVEVLYTSAAQGLKAGSRGFCTVLSTAGLPPNLGTRLEALSAYKHVFPPGHAEASKNPVCYSHLRMNSSGRSVSVLSRIADYGVDYSQRTNKLAHHVAIEGSELVPAGPGWVLKQKSVMRDLWDGHCATPAEGPEIPRATEPPRDCVHWTQLCKDAGWAGVVAEALAQPVGKPLWIVFNIAQSTLLLELMSEAVSLLPIEQRWNATFSTYATNLPPDVECKVRCVLAETDSARLAPALGKVIDLTRPLPTLEESPYVRAARDGKQIPILLPPVSVAEPRSKTKPNSESDSARLRVEEKEKSKAVESHAKETSPLVKGPKFANRTQTAVTDSVSKLKWALAITSFLALFFFVTTVALLINRNRITSRRVAVAMNAEPVAKLPINIDVSTQESEKPVTDVNAVPADGRKAETDTSTAIASPPQPDPPKPAPAQPVVSTMLEKPKREPVTELPNENKAIPPSTLAEEPPKPVAPPEASPQVGNEDLNPLERKVESKSRDDSNEFSTIAAMRISNDASITIDLQVPLSESLEGKQYVFEGSPKAIKENSSISFDSAVKSKGVQTIKVENFSDLHLTVQLKLASKVLPNSSAIADGFRRIPLPIREWNTRLKQLYGQLKEDGVSTFQVLTPFPSPKNFQSTELVSTKLSMLDGLIKESKKNELAADKLASEFEALKNRSPELSSKFINDAKLLKVPMTDLSKICQEVLTSIHDLNTDKVIDLGEVLELKSKSDGSSRANVTKIRAKFRFQLPKETPGDVKP